MTDLEMLTVTKETPGTRLAGAAWPTANGSPCVWLTSELIGTKVVSPSDEHLGSIEDVVVHPSGRTPYAVLSFGGWLGMGDKLFAIPWTALRTVEANPAKPDSARALVLPVDKERLKTAPGFDKEHWPTSATRDGFLGVDTFYAGDVSLDTYRPIDSATYRALNNWRVTDLVGTDVTTPTGEKLGDVEQLAIDTNGRIKYAVVSVGGFLGMGEHHVAVPWDSLSFPLDAQDSDTKRITLASTKAVLEKAPQFKKGKEHRVEMCDPTWIRHVYDFYGSPQNVAAIVR